LHFRKIDHPPCSSQRVRVYLTHGFHFSFLIIFAGFSLAGAQYARAQEAEAGPVAPVTAPAELRVPVNFDSTSLESSSADQTDAEAVSAAPMEGMSASQIIEPAKPPVESEIIIEGLASYGNYKIFASSFGDKLYVGGVEYDRHSWGRFLKADVDYVAEFLPFVLLDKPQYVDLYGNPNPLKLEYKRQYVPGIGFSPIGFRMQWMSKRRFKPYLEAKGGVLVFTQKVPAAQASYESFSLQSGTGVQVRMNERWGLRLGLFSDFHFSNAFVVAINPGLDVMNANLGISYHLGHKDK
jgi:hypothetical protein